MSLDQLEAALLAAHQHGDGARLAHLYAQAADMSAGEASAFYLCQAYVFALESGEAIAGQLHGRLVALGREA